MQRPGNADADMWAMYLEELLAAHEIPSGEIAFLSVQIAEAIGGWRPIDTAPHDEEIILGVFNINFVDPLVMNACWIDGDERGGKWSDWHGFPEPTHWRPLNPPTA